MNVPIVRTVAELRATAAQWRRQGATIAVVPTMGALHEGHLSLVRTALARADRVIVTLFVNPKQFNSAADLAAYPRTEEEDAAKLAPLGAHLLYAPDAAEIYPDGFATTVSVAGVSEGLCGAFRPGHFDGVATVVAKLFLQTGADVALFGEKDFQQLHVVRRMARDLDIPITIVGCPTVREADGLALSSRNVRLSPAERRAAPKLASILFEAARRLSNGAKWSAVRPDHFRSARRDSCCRFCTGRVSGTAGGRDSRAVAGTRQACAVARRRVAWRDAADRQREGQSVSEFGQSMIHSNALAAECISRSEEEGHLASRLQL